MIKKKFGNPQATFSEKVVAFVLSVPKGRVTTYGIVARRAGGGNMASRSITRILGTAYSAGLKDIPFHRIVYANGKVWLSDEYAKERMKRYKEEGIDVDDRGRIKDFSVKLFGDYRDQDLV